jgi:hypothetical protein
MPTNTLTITGINAAKPREKPYKLSASPYVSLKQARSRRDEAKRAIADSADPQVRGFRVFTQTPAPKPGLGLLRCIGSRAPVARRFARVDAQAS